MSPLNDHCESKGGVMLIAQTGELSLDYVSCKSPAVGEIGLSLLRGSKSEEYARIQESRQEYESKILCIEIFEGFLIHSHLSSFIIS